MTRAPARIAGAGLVCRRMQHASFGGEAVLLPHPLDMDERRLPQAIDGMLEAEMGMGSSSIADSPPSSPEARGNSWMVTPSGRPSRSIVTR